VVGPHQMVVIGRSGTGAEEWGCPSCGRRILLRWPPHHERIILHPGDDQVVHVGGRREVPDDPAGTPSGELTDQERRWLSACGIVWD
jgi:hypothetical protein